MKRILLLFNVRCVFVCVCVYRKEWIKNSSLCNSNTFMSRNSLVSSQIWWVYTSLPTFSLVFPCFSDFISEREAFTVIHMKTFCFFPQNYDGSVLLLSTHTYRHWRKMKVKEITDECKVLMYFMILNEKQNQTLFMLFKELGVFK